MPCRPILFVTGTDTGIGKTVLAVMIVRFLKGAGVPVAAFKPVCSGGRNDARQLREALGGEPSLDAINPWHYRAPLAPNLAARREGRRLRFAQVLDYLRDQRPAKGIMLIEGAGGLLSPLGEDFDSRDLLLALRAIPIVVCPNRLGALNQVRLVLEALPPARAAQTRVVLAPPLQIDGATEVNAKSLTQFFPANRITVLPRRRNSLPARSAREDPELHRVLSRLLRPWI